MFVPVELRRYIGDPSGGRYESERHARIGAVVIGSSIEHERDGPNFSRRAITTTIFKVHNTRTIRMLPEDVTIIRYRNDDYRIQAIETVRPTDKYVTVSTIRIAGS